VPSHLPPATQPWRIPITRRHTPRAARGKSGFQSYRQCLRWEFGFSCAFCLLHEMDLFTPGVEGTGLTGIEHFEPKSLNEAGRNQYENLFYCCRFCNSAHGSLPVADPEGRRLLNPCEVAWRDFFELRGDELHARDEGDATYTHEVYDLNDRRKVVLRQKRREALAVRSAYLAEGRGVLDSLIERARDTGDIVLVDESERLWEWFEKVISATKHLTAVPAIPAETAACSCGHEVCSLPEVLAEQLT
jgi:hypothetical protein